MTTTWRATSPKTFASMVRVACVVSQGGVCTLMTFVFHNGRRGCLFWFSACFLLIKSNCSRPFKTAGPVKFWRFYGPDHVFFGPRRNRKWSSTQRKYMGAEKSTPPNYKKAGRWALSGSQSHSRPPCPPRLRRAPPLQSMNASEKFHPSVVDPRHAVADGLSGGPPRRGGSPGWPFVFVLVAHPWPRAGLRLGGGAAVLHSERRCAKACLPPLHPPCVVGAGRIPPPQDGGV